MIVLIGVLVEGNSLSEKTVRSLVFYVVVFCFVFSNFLLFSFFLAGK